MKGLIICCLVAVGIAAEIGMASARNTKRVARSNYGGGCPPPSYIHSSEYETPSYSPPMYNSPPAYSPPAVYAPPSPPPSVPSGYVVSPPKPIQYQAPKPTTTTILIHNAEAPPPRPTVSVPLPSRPSYSQGMGSTYGSQAYGR